MNLNNKELDQIKQICTKIELHEYKSGGWSKLSGGFAVCDMTDYDDDEIYLELKCGVETDFENRTYTDNITLDRHTMEITKD